MRRKGVWLATLVAGCFTTAFAQGVQEFTSSATFTVPAAITALRIDSYGPGGGGGGGNSSNSEVYGGGGGGGAYNAGVIAVSAGEVLTITIGNGGVAGASGNAGGPGGTTKILNASGTVLLSANGGKGGQPASGSADGAGGAGGAEGTLGSIRHAGVTGSSLLGDPGNGYIPVGYPTGTQTGKYGTFGAGGFGGESTISATNGENGYVLISWF